MLFNYFSHKVLRWILPLCLIILFGVNIRLVFCSDSVVYPVIMGLQLLFYSVALAVHLYGAKVRIKFMAIPYYFCLSNSAVLYGLYKGLLNKQSVKWKRFSRVKSK